MSSLKILPKADEGKYTSRRIVEESKLKCKKCKFYSLKKMFELQVWGCFFHNYSNCGKQFFHDIWSRSESKYQVELNP